MRLLKSLFYQLVDAIQVFKEKGMKVGFVRLGKTIERVFYVRRERWVFALPLSQYHSKTTFLPDLVVRPLKDRKEIVLLEALASIVDIVRFRQMFDGGSAAFIALLNERLVGWGWIAFSIDPEIDRTQAPLLPGDACLYELFVAPAYRGRRIAQQLVDYRLRFLQENGYKRAIISCSKGDVPALKVAERVGYIKIGESSHTRFLFWDQYKFIPSATEERYRV